MKTKVFEMLTIVSSQLVRENRKIYRQEKQIIAEVMKAINEDKCTFDVIDKIIDAGQRLASLEKAKSANNKKREKLIKAA